MIILVGTGHVFDLSSALNVLFDEKQPDVIGVELDPQRYQAILVRQSNPERYKHSKKQLPMIYQMLARFQEDMAHEYGVNAGDEMLAAITYAHAHQLPLEFLDVNAQKLFITMWKTMPLREKTKLLFSGFGSFFISKKRVEKEMENLKENLDVYLDEIGKKFPTIKKVLIDERNDHIAHFLMKLHETYHTIIACVGDGHIPGLSVLLKEKSIPFETIRLHELQNIHPTADTPGSAHFSIHYHSP